MFGDLLGNMEEKQKEIKKKLAEMTVEAESGDGAVKVTANANREIVDLSIDRSKIDLQEEEQLEDLLLVALNRALERAAEKESEETQRMMQDLLPPGLGGMSDLFG